LRQLESEHVQAQTARDSAANLVVQLDELKRQLETQRSTAERLQVKLDVTRGTLATARESLEQARQAAAIVTAAQAGYENYQAAAAKLTELERQRASRDELRQQFAVSERALIEAQSQAQRLRERQDELTAARAESARLADPVAAQHRLETRLAELRESRGEAQSLERARLTLDKELEQMRQRFSTLSREIEKAE